MVDALEAVHLGISLHSDFEFGLMLGAAQATLQGLAPEDFDNDQGVDALVAIFAMLTKEHDRDTIHVTPEWRRVVISARRLKPRRDGERFWRWRASGEATSVSQVLIPVL
jgi:hypothetical protein